MMNHQTNPTAQNFADPSLGGRLVVHSLFSPGGFDTLHDSEGECCQISHGGARKFINRLIELLSIVK